MVDIIGLVEGFHIEWAAESIPHEQARIDFFTGQAILFQIEKLFLCEGVEHPDTVSIRGGSAQAILWRFGIAMGGVRVIVFQKRPIQRIIIGIDNAVLGRSNNAQTLCGSLIQYLLMLVDLPPVGNAKEQGHSYQQPGQNPAERKLLDASGNR